MRFASPAEANLRPTVLEIWESSEGHGDHSGTVVVFAIVIVVVALVFDVVVHGVFLMIRVGVFIVASVVVVEVVVIVVAVVIIVRPWGCQKLLPLS